MGLPYLEPWCLPLVPGLLPTEHLDSLELQETGPGASVSLSIPKTPGDTEGGAGYSTATCLLGRSQLVFLLALRFFLAVLLI